MDAPKRGRDGASTFAVAASDDAAVTAFPGIGDAAASTGAGGGAASAEAPVPILPAEDASLVRGEVVKLDRGFPLVRLEDGRELRCEHAANIKKHGELRAVIGDVVLLSGVAPTQPAARAAADAAPDAAPDAAGAAGAPDAAGAAGAAATLAHDKAIVRRILPRSTQLVRKDPSERAIPQVLAANFHAVLVVQPVNDVNIRRMERELVLAHETGAQVAVVLTKADLVSAEEERAATARVRGLLGADAPLFVISRTDAESLARVRSFIAPGITAVLIGRSGVGKSSLVNLLVGRDVQATERVRAGDGKGRHTTVDRAILELPGGGRVVDMPGVRGLGMWEADAGIGSAFADVEELAAQCRFRDCRHGSEPGCAVRAAVEKGELSAARAESYRTLKNETRTVRRRKEESRWRKH